MKRLILLGICGGVIVGGAFYLKRHKAAPPSPAESTAKELPVSGAPESSGSLNSGVPQQTEAQKAPIQTDPAQAPLAASILKEAATDNSSESTPFRQAMDILVSPQSTFQQRQAAWNQLRNAGELDHALESLKQGAANNPASAEYSIALGKAYVYKLQTLGDFHEVAILALKADQSFNTALGVDPANWEAQFFKAASLSRWPADMNKGPEVIEQLSHLIDQQEAMASQPQFVQSYVLLGDQYKRSGQADYAMQTWRLGLVKFPADSTLQGRLAQP